MPQVGRYFLRHLCLQDEVTGRSGIPWPLPRDYVPAFLLHLFLRILGDGRHAVRLACARTMLLSLMKSEGHVVPIPFLGAMVRMM